MQVLFWIFIAIIISFSNAGDNSALNRELAEITKPYKFSMAAWEVKTNFNHLARKITDRQPESALNSETVIRYFDLINNINYLEYQIRYSEEDSVKLNTELEKLKEELAGLKPAVEQTLSKQITEILREQGIKNPVGNFLGVSFPGVYFKLEEPLYSFIVSPRDRIDRISETLIDQGTAVEQMEEMEGEAAKLDVSALTVTLGGMGAAYPSFVIDDADLKFTINTATEEWVHQYLAFKPLGFKYVLDLLNIRQDQDIATINETVAGITSDEIGSLVYEKYYSQYFPETETEQSDNSGEGFNFNQQMRLIRLTVDGYLAAGKIEEAEEYMNEQRQYLQDNGYYIRKLNQAYFAFHGSYADSPTSVDPVGDEVRSLREQSLSLKIFFETASGITTRQALAEAISQSNN